VGNIIANRCRSPPIHYPTSEETFSACEWALEWFEAWDQHADHEHDFGGEHA
jgi:hypothetical protein